MSIIRQSRNGEKIVLNAKATAGVCGAAETLLSTEPVPQPASSRWSRC
jgi:hypothetical protein